MTYGDVTSRLREAMTWLLERRRITQQIGGPGSFRVPVTTTEADRMAMGEEIQRYRAAVLTFCLEAVRAVTPTADLEVTERLRDPAIALRHQLEVARSATPADAQPSSLMTLRPSFDLVSRWQDAARIAIEGEREMAAVRRQPLSRKQQGQVLKDAADLARGLVVLDVRYKNVPGWRFLEQKGRLMTAATAVSEELEATAVDASIDGLGWRPTPGTIEGPALYGLAGVLQAQHNVAVDLSHFPSAANLRHALVAQADLSRRAGEIARSVHSPTAPGFDERAELYRQLVTAARTLGGEIGTGRQAAIESAAAARRMTPGAEEGEEKVDQALGKLAQLNRRVDARIAAALEHGFRDKLYFTAIKLPTLGPPGSDGIARPVQKFVPPAPGGPCQLLRLARERLRPPTAPPSTPGQGGRTSRANFTHAISHGCAASSTRR